MTPSVVLAGGVRKGTLSREQVIKKILRWNALYGEPPCTADWNPSLARWRAQEWRIERYRQGDPETGEPWPSLNSAKRLFDGSFDAATRAAGLVPHRPGPRRRAAGVARPDVEQRAPQAPRDVEAELVAASERVLEAERRAQRAERRAAAAERRKPERVLVEVPVPVEVEVRVEVPVPANGNGNGKGHVALTTTEIAALREGDGPVGPGPLADALKALATARATKDSRRLHEALNQVASAAVRWRERL